MSFESNVETNSTPSNTETNSEFTMSEGNYIPSWRTEGNETSNESPEEPVEEVVETGSEDADDAAEVEATEAESGDDTEVNEDEELPIEQLKDYDPKTYAAYAKRFGYTVEEMENDPRIKNVIRQKIDSDVFIRDQKAAAEAAKLKAEAGVDTKSEEQKEEPVTPQDAAAQREQYLKSLEEVATQVTSPEMAKMFGEGLLEAWGFDLKAEDAETKALIERAPKLANLYTKFGVNLIHTFMPQMFAQYMESNFPGFRTAWEDTETHRQWEMMRRSDESLKSLPAYGTPEQETLMTKAREIEPEIDNMVFRDKNGRLLNKQEQTARRFRFAAKLVSSSQPKTDPAIASKAVETGKRLAQKNEQVERVARATGAGQSKGQFVPSKDKAGSGLGIVESYQKSSRNILGD